MTGRHSPCIGIRQESSNFGGPGKIPGVACFEDVWLRYGKPTDIKTSDNAVWFNLAPDVDAYFVPTLCGIETIEEVLGDVRDPEYFYVRGRWNKNRHAFMATVIDYEGKIYE